MNRGRVGEEMRGKEMDRCPLTVLGTTSQIRALITILNKALRLIRAAFHTSPIYTLEIKTAIPPLDIHLEMMIQNAAIRLNKIAKRSPIIQQLPNEWRHNKQPTSNPPIPTTTNSKAHKPKTTSLLKLAKRQNPNCEKITINIPPWTKTANDLRNKIEILHLTCLKDKSKETAREHTISVRSQSSNQTILTIYTDGSKTEEGTGTGYIAYHRNHTITKKEIGMGSQAETFNTEK
jgi:hypothetical protein